MTTNTPTVSGGAIVSWSISPTLPTGLAFDTSTGAISGTPTQLLTRAMYTITATNSGGTATAYLNITVVDELPTIAYSPNDLDLTNNTVQQRPSALADDHWFGDDHILGHQSISAKRLVLQRFHWCAQWNAN